MAWTEDRVTRLTTLWQKGLSASQIAADLGGVTRNAVIGKIHRLGMSNRDKAPGTGGKPKAAPKATEGQPAVEVGVGSPKSEAAKVGNAGSARRPQANPRGGAGTPAGGGSTVNSQRTAASGGGTHGNAAFKMELEEDAAPEMEQQQATDEVVVPISRKLDLLQLTETTCKWPTGDPTMPGFSFCGHTSQDEKPYCEYHSKLAFQPPSERRRRR